MLYYFYELLDLNILQYISVRAGFAFFIALTFTLALMPRFIEWAKKSSSVQPINEYAPKSHQSKVSVPTMGGVVFIVATILASIISIDMSNFYALGAILTLMLFALIGFRDDYTKIAKKDNLAGLSARMKFVLQIIVATAIALFLIFIAELDTLFYLPFFKDAIFDMGIFALFFWIFIIVGVSNAVNLTDGLDGLATVPSIFSLMTLGVFIYIIGHSGLSAYLYMPHFDAGETVIVAAALIGALIGFLWFNSHPAEVFMGDSGSLAIGALIGYLGIVAKSEVLLILIGAIFVAETLSVLIQVGVYKWRQKRVFLMAPIHHHFEMKNWVENKIIVRFWIIAMLTNLLALITLKIR